MSSRTAKNKMVPFETRRQPIRASRFQLIAATFAVRVYLTSQGEATPHSEKHWEMVHLDDKALTGQVP